MSRLNTEKLYFYRALALAFLLCILTGITHGGQDDFTLPDIDGRAHSLSDYRGKWVLVNYWATWCPPCLEELPELEVFHTNAEGKAVVLGVNMEEIDEPQLRAFVEQQGAVAEHAVDGGELCVPGNLAACHGDVDRKGKR